MLQTRQVVVLLQDQSLLDSWNTHVHSVEDCMLSLLKVLVQDMWSIVLLLGREFADVIVGFLGPHM